MNPWQRLHRSIPYDVSALVPDLTTADQPSKVKRQTTTCPPGSKSQFCQRPVSESTDITLPVVLGVVIPVVFAIIVFIWLHRRHVRNLRNEDARDKHGSLDFGLPDVVEPRPKSKRFKSEKSEPEVSQTDDKLSETTTRTRGVSFDMGSPYILPSGLHDTRGSFHSLSRSAHDEDPYHSVAMMNGGERVSGRYMPRPSSQNRLENGSISGSSDSTSLHGPRGTLLRYAQHPARSTPPMSSMSNTPPSSPPIVGTPTFPPPAFSNNRKFAAIEAARKRGSNGSVEAPTRLVREGSDKQGAFVLPTRHSAQPSQDNSEDVSDTASSSNEDSGSSRKLHSNKSTGASSCTSIDQLAIEERKTESMPVLAVIPAVEVINRAQPNVEEKFQPEVEEKIQPKPVDLAQPTVEERVQPQGVSTTSVIALEAEAKSASERTLISLTTSELTQSAIPSVATMLPVAQQEEEPKPVARPTLTLPHFAQRGAPPAVEPRKPSTQHVEARRMSPQPLAPPPDMRRSPQQSLSRRSSGAAASPKMASLAERIEPYDENATYADVLGIVQSPSTRSPPPAGGRPYSPKMTTIHEPATAGLGVQGLRMPKHARRYSSNIRPLPPSDPSDDPEQRANRIRSFYREYFDESRSNHKPTTPSRPDYYEDYGQEYLGDAAIHDPEGSRYANVGAPFAQSITRRAMTPPPRAPPRFRGSPKPRTSVGSNSFHGSTRSGPRAYSASGRMPMAQRKVIVPPSPLNILPMPSKLKDDMMSPIEFAPVSRFGPASPRSPSGGQKFNFGPRGHVPLASSFDDLAVMPSPHALRDSSTFSALDFAPPTRFRDGAGVSDTGSLRSGRSGPAAHAANARAGAYRVSRIPNHVVGTRDDFSVSLKPTWDVRSS